MTSANCGWCGRVSHGNAFCSRACGDKLARLQATPLQTFRSYAEAARFYARDTRTLRKWENVLFRLDKSLPSPQAKLRPCRVCTTPFAAHENRHGYLSGVFARGRWPRFASAPDRGALPRNGKSKLDSWRVRAHVSAVAARKSMGACATNRDFKRFVNFPRSRSADARCYKLSRRIIKRRYGVSFPNTLHRNLASRRRNQRPFLNAISARQRTA